MDNDLIETIQATAEIYGKTMSAMAARMFLEDLKGFSKNELMHSLSECRKELRNFPTVADVANRIQTRDGRPGVEEAWALCPNEEKDTAVWTNEISKAYFSGPYDLIQSDPIAARMTFKEKYLEIVKKNRSERIPFKWEVSLGFDKRQAERKLIDAVSLGRIEKEHAKVLLPASAYAIDRTEVKLISPNEEVKKLT